MSKVTLDAVLAGLCTAAIVLSVSACSGPSPSTTVFSSVPVSSATTPSSRTTTAASTTTTVGATLSGMGATLGAFKAAHPADNGLPTVCSASDSCFGPELTNAEYGKTYQLINTLIAVGIIIGYQQNFPPGTDLATAQAEILQLMPKDAVMGAITVDDNSGSCAIFNITSSTLGSVFDKQAIGDPQGVVGVELADITSSGNVTYNPEDIQEANLSTQPVDPTSSC